VSFLQPSSDRIHFSWSFDRHHHWMHSGGNLDSGYSLLLPCGTSAPTSLQATAAQIVSEFRVAYSIQPHTPRTVNLLSVPVHLAPSGVTFKMSTFVICSPIYIHNKRLSNGVTNPKQQASPSNIQWRPTGLEAFSFRYHRRMQLFGDNSWTAINLTVEYNEAPQLLAGYGRLRRVATHGRFCARANDQMVSVINSDA
jgi:hypothetical protein